MKRFNVFWIDRRSNLCSGEVCAEMTLHFDSSEHPQNSYSGVVLENEGIDSFIIDMINQGMVGETFYVVTGVTSLVPKSHCEETREKAFDNFIKRVAKLNNIGVENETFSNIPTPG